MQYHVRAVTSAHLMTQLTIDARDESEVCEQLAARGLYAASITAAGVGIASMRIAGRRRLSLVLFSQELRALLNAGLTIVESLEALLEKEAASAANVTLSSILTALREGKRFSSALSEQPDVFPPLFIGIVRAAEGTSDLPQSLTRFIDYQQRLDAIRTKLISAAIYPLILLLVGGAVSLFLIGYVVPRFAQVYEGSGRALPWLSQQMLDWGKFATTQPALLTALIFAALMGLILLVRRLGGGGAARFLARLPGVGERIQIYALSRLYLTLGMLLEGGIPIVPALRTVQQIVAADMQPQLQQASLSIESGTPLSTAFDTHRLTTPISLRMLRVGERTGEMGTMLTQSALFYDGEISRWIDRFSRAFEPLLMAAIGIVVGMIVILLYMPIFDLAGSLQ